MANEQRVREDYKTGTVLDAPLAFDATTMTSDELTAVREVTTDQHMTITLDPHGEGNGPETAWIIEHEAASDTATLARGREATTGVEHAADTPWAIGPGKSDFMQYVAGDDELPVEDGIPYPGQPFYDLGGGVTLVGAPSMEGPIYRHSGDEYGRAWNHPWGLIKQTDLSLENILLAAGISFNTPVDWNLSMTAGLREGRMYQVEVSGAVGGAGGLQTAIADLCDGSNTVITHLAHLILVDLPSGAGARAVLKATHSFRQTVTGSGTFKLRGYVTSSGLINFGGQFATPAYMRLFDMGPFAGP